MFKGKYRTDHLKGKETTFAIKATRHLGVLAFLNKFTFASVYIKNSFIQLNLF